MPAAGHNHGNNSAADESPAELKKKLDASRKELNSLLSKKRGIDRNLAMLEASIYAFETSYLGTSDPNTPQFGNIVKGYDAYVKAVNTGSHGLGDRKKGNKSGAANNTSEIKEEDRLFSRSSGTFERALELKEKEGVSQASSDNDEDATPAPKSKKRRV